MILASQRTWFSNTLDPDAVRMCQAGGITDRSIWGTVSTYLAKPLKQNGLWSLMHALYPFVGGTSQSCAQNLISGSLFTMTWVNAPTFDANGVTFNGSTTYGDTNLNANSVVTALDSSLGVYINSAGAALRGLIAAQGATEELLLWNTNAGPLMNFDSGTFAGRGANASPASTTGMFSGCRGGSTDRRQYHNGSLLLTTVSAGANPCPNLNLYVGAFNTGGAVLIFSGRMALAWIGKSLSTAQMSTMYSIVQAYQTALGRNV